MDMSVYQYIIEKRAAGQKMLALLLDPDAYGPDRFVRLEQVLQQCQPGLIFVGGSLVTADTSVFISRIKAITTVPVILFQVMCPNFPRQPMPCSLSPFCRVVIPNSLLGNMWWRHL